MPLRHAASPHTRRGNAGVDPSIRPACRVGTATTAPGLSLEEVLRPSIIPASGRSNICSRLPVLQNGWIDIDGIDEPSVVRTGLPRPGLRSRSTAHTGSFDPKLAIRSSRSTRHPSRFARIAARAPVLRDDEHHRERRDWAGHRHPLVDESESLRRSAASGDTAACRALPRSSSFTRLRHRASGQSASRTT